MRLPLFYTQSMDWDEALEAISRSCPELSEELDLLDQLTEEQLPIPQELKPIAELVFLLQTDPLTPSRH